MLFLSSKSSPTSAFPSQQPHHFKVSGTNKDHVVPVSIPPSLSRILTTTTDYKIRRNFLNKRTKTISLGLSKHIVVTPDNDEKQSKDHHYSIMTMHNNVKPAQEVVAEGGRNRRRDVLLQIASTATLSSTIPTFFNMEKGGSCLAHAAMSSPSVSSSSPLSSVQTLQIIPAKTVTTDSTSFFSTIQIPRVGYSLYKTDPSQVDRCVRIALYAGIRYFDVGSQYGSNEEVGKVLTSYIWNGLPSIDDKGYEVVLAENDSIVKDSSSRKQYHKKFTNQRKQQESLLRRKELFISHKLSNQEQSVDDDTVRRNILHQIQTLTGSTSDYLDMVMIHSPLTDKARRLATYRSLLDLQSQKKIRAIGVCNYGITPLNEIIDAGLPPPSVIQLQLSPFNQHADVMQFAKQHGCVLECSAWSRLSSADGPQDGWAVVSEIAKQKGMTKAQVLVRWALQHNYLSLPRSAVTSKIERKAIYENSFDGVASSQYTLSQEDMNALDSLDVKLRPGKLGVRDGWSQNEEEGFHLHGPSPTSSSSTLQFDPTLIL